MNYWKEAEIAQKMDVSQALDFGYRPKQVENKRCLKRRNKADLEHVKEVEDFDRHNSTS